VPLERHKTNSVENRKKLNKNRFWFRTADVTLPAIIVAKWSFRKLERRNRRYLLIQDHENENISQRTKFLSSKFDRKKKTVHTQTSADK
jgi:hypothetical protein